MNYKQNSGAATNNNFVIFYADDDADDREIFSDVVEEISAKPIVSVLDGGYKLLTALKSPPPLPNIVFLDLNMPGINGFELLRQIKGSQELKHLPVVIISTSGDEETRRTSFKFGADFFVTKSTNYLSFKKSILEALQFNGFAYN